MCCMEGLTFFIPGNDGIRKAHSSNFRQIVVDRSEFVLPFLSGEVTFQIFYLTIDQMLQTD